MLPPYKGPPVRTDIAENPRREARAKIVVVKIVKASTSGRSVNRNILRIVFTNSVTLAAAKLGGAVVL
eukprot:9864039-Karenia_brevis.AAC.1